MTPTPGLDSISTKVGCVRSHRPERRPFGLTSLETGGWRCPMGRRWRLASGRQKVVKWGHCRLASRGACGAGGAPAPGSGATTPLPGAGGQKAPSTRRCIMTLLGILLILLRLVRKHPAPQGALRLSQRRWQHPRTWSQKAPSTTRCIKTMRRRTREARRWPSESTQHHKVH